MMTLSILIWTNSKKLNKWGILHTFCFCSIAFLAIASHFKAMTTDPGGVPPDAQPLTDTLDDKDTLNGMKEPSILPRRPRRQCRRCNVFKPDRAHHCSICKRCVVKMDQ